MSAAPLDPLAPRRSPTHDRRFDTSPSGTRFCVRSAVGACACGGPGVGETRGWGLVGQSPQHPRRSGATSAGEAASARPWWRRALARVASGSAWWIIAWALILVAATVIAWMRCPAWLTDIESGSTTIRNLGLVILAAVGLPLAIWRSLIAERQGQAAHRQSEIAEQNLRHDRFQKGAEMLGHPDIGSVRIGGIHALARLAAEFPDVFHVPVMRTLAAFVVDRTKGEGEEEQQESVGPEEGNDYSGYAPLEVSLAANSEVGPVPELAKDVEEAMRTIVQQGASQIAAENDGTFRRNLAAAKLIGADLRNATLGLVDLAGENLWKGAICPSKLVGTELVGADLRNAVIGGADMRGTSLGGAKLDNANFSRRQLERRGLERRGSSPCGPQQYESRRREP